MGHCLEPPRLHNLINLHLTFFACTEARRGAQVGRSASGHCSPASTAPRARSGECPDLGSDIALPGIASSPSALWQRHAWRPPPAAADLLAPLSLSWTGAARLGPGPGALLPTPPSTQLPRSSAPMSGRAGDRKRKRSAATPTAAPLDVVAACLRGDQAALEAALGVEWRHGALLPGCRFPQLASSSVAGCRPLDAAIIGNSPGCIRLLASVVDVDAPKEVGGSLLFAGSSPLLGCVDGSCSVPARWLLPQRPRMIVGIAFTSAAAPPPALH